MERRLGQRHSLAEGSRTLKGEGLVKAFGISVNRWQPTNVLKALDTGLIDSVQVVYNVLDQSPEDELFPMCEEKNIAIIARVPFDEGSLTGTLTVDSTWPEGDFRNRYFHPENLEATLPRIERVKTVLPSGCRCRAGPPHILAAPCGDDGHPWDAEGQPCGAEHRHERCTGHYQRSLW